MGRACPSGPVGASREEEHVSRIVIAGVMLAAFVYGGPTARAQEQEAVTPAAAVPKAILKLLDQRWEGWRLATVENTGACAAMLNGRSPSFVRADLNGDGIEDVALQIGPDWLRYSHDHVLDDMLRGFGLVVSVEQLPFEPEGGAYVTASTHSHSHG